MTAVTVAVVTPTSTGARVAQYGRQLAMALSARAGLEAWDLLLVEPGASESNDAAPEALAALTLAGPAPLALGVPGTLAHLRRAGPQVVLLQCSPLTPPWVLPLVGFAAGRGGRRMVLQVHEAGCATGRCDPEPRGRAWRRVQPAAVVASGEHAAAWAVAADLAGRGEVVVIPGLATARSRVAHDGRSYELLAFIPDDDRQARHDLIRAFDGISDTCVDGYHLTVVTRGAGLAETEALVAGCHHADRVHLLSADLDDRRLRALVARADVVIVPDPPASSRAVAMVMEAGVPLVAPARDRRADAVAGYTGTVPAALTNPPDLLVGIELALARRGTRHPAPDRWEAAVDALAGMVLTAARGVR